MRRVVVLLLVLSAGLSAQTPLSGPVEGFTFDVPTKSFRAVLGVLGSATLGPALLGGLDYGSVAPHQNYGIAFIHRKGFVISGLGSGHVSRVELPGSLTVPDSIAWSGDGSVAVFYSRAANSIQMVVGLPGAAAAGWNVSLQGGTLSSIAPDSTGEHVAIGLTGDLTGDMNGVFLVPSFARLLAVSRPVSLAFSGDDATLYVLDAAAGQVSELNVANLSSQSWPITELKDPYFLRSARDATNRPVIYVAGRNDRSLVAYDAASHAAIAQVPLSFQPTSLEPLGRGSLMLAARAEPDDPLWSFTNASMPVVYFVPAPIVPHKDRVR
jgi:hypothetical protein